MFEHTKVEIPEGSFGISPSGIGRFFSNPVSWCNTNLRGGELITTTSMVLGTTVHEIIDQYLKGNLDTSEKRDVMNEFVETFVDNESKRLLDLDTGVILGNYKPMSEAAINGIISNGMLGGDSEVSMALEVADSFYLRGTSDYIYGDCIVDWKTTSLMSAPKDINFGYLIQSLAYAKMANNNGYTIDRIAIGYITRNNVGRISDKTNKPMRDYPSTLTMRYHQITQEDWELLDDAIQLIVESVKLVKEHPEYMHIVFKSMGLKQS